MDKILLIYSYNGETVWAYLYDNADELKADLLNRLRSIFTLEDDIALAFDELINTRDSFMLCGRSIDIVRPIYKRHRKK